MATQETGGDVTPETVEAAAVDSGLEPLWRLNEQRDDMTAVVLYSDGSGHLEGCGKEIRGTGFGFNGPHADANAAIRSLLPPSPAEDLTIVLTDSGEWSVEQAIALSRLGWFLGGKEYPPEPMPCA